MGIAREAQPDGQDGLSESERLVKALKDEEERGMAITRSYAAMWQENLRYFFSEQLDGKKRHKDWDWIVVNYIWPAAMQEAAKLSQLLNSRQFLCDPRENSDAEAAEVWQGWAQWMWQQGLNREGMEIEQLKAILCGKLFGYRVFKLYWEPRDEWDDREKRWQGEVKGRLWKPMLFWSTGEESIQDGSCGTVRYVDLEYALARWPDYAQQLKDEARRGIDEVSSGEGTIRGQMGLNASYPSSGSGGSDRESLSGQGNPLLGRIMEAIGAAGRKRQVEDKTQYVKISETWFQDYSEQAGSYEEPISEQELLQTGRIIRPPDSPLFLDAQTREPLDASNWPTRPPVKWKEPLFPNGRYILRAGDTILNQDKEEQRYPYRIWPFITSPHYLIPFMWQGSDCVQLVKTSQDMINVSVSHLVNHMKQHGDPKIAVERGAIDSPKARDKKHFRIGSGAGAIIRLVRGGLSRMKIMDPPNASPVLGMLYSLFSNEFKNIVGLHDIAQGKKTPGDLTATESSYLAMSANDRINLQAALERVWMQRVVSLGVDIAQQNYEPQRMVRILGEDAVPGIVQITQGLKEARFDIYVQVGSALPFDPEKRIARYMQANQLLMAPPTPMLPDLLRAMDIPNWRKILAKLPLWQQWMQFQQLGQAVQKGEVPPEQAIQLVAQQAAQQFMASAPKEEPKGNLARAREQEAQQNARNQ